MKKVWNLLRPAIAGLLVFTVICGVLYTGAVTGIAQLLFPQKANGSVIEITKADGTTLAVGSALIGQEFTQAKYLIGRPMVATNLSPVGAEQKELVAVRTAWWQQLDPANNALIPQELVLGSGSGADPNISPAAADYQAARIAKARGMTEAAVRDIITSNTTQRLLGIWGEPAVNILQVNLALDANV